MLQREWEEERALAVEKSKLKLQTARRKRPWRAIWKAGIVVKEKPSDCNAILVLVVYKAD